MGRLYGIIVLVLWLAAAAFGQARWRVVSYNVENLFDTRDDPATQDEDFTPSGRLHWSKDKYRDKLRKLAQAITAVGEGEMPVLVGLCEVENRHVVEDLTHKTRLAAAGYGIVHHESPDARGIDVALLYRKDAFQIVEERFMPVFLDEETHTRDVLYVCGVMGTDTLHVMVCHFPSMSGGEAASEWKRDRAAAVVRQRVDEVLSADSTASVVIMGDLNGKADRSAQTKVLGTRPSEADSLVSGRLYNTGYHLLRSDHGSYKYQGAWQTIDHIIVNGAMLNGEAALRVTPRLKVFRADFLLEEDKSYFGFKPFRTYVGPRYHGGYSDHLPVYVDLTRSLKE